MNEDAEMWRTFNERKKKEASDRLKDRTELVEFLSGYHGFNIVKIADYHLRLFLPHGTIDYFPKTGKATKLGSNKWVHISDIEVYINKRYKPTT